MPELVIGRIVRYHSVDPVDEHPAIITHILRTEEGRYLEKGTCNLTVFTPWGMQLVTANYGTDGGEWEWPEYDQPQPRKEEDDSGRDDYHKSSNMEPTPPEETVG